MALDAGRPDSHLRADGRRGNALRRHGAVHRHAAHFCQSWRRHLPTFRHPGDPPGTRRARAHHVQAAVQRRGGDDRRAAGRGRTDRAAHRRPACRGGRAAHRGGGGRGRPAAARARPAARHHAACARRPGRGAARTARLRGRLGADLRPGLRHGKAPAAQARLDGATGAARRHQRAGLRELRRLLDAVGVHRDRAGRDGARPQAAHQSDKLQRRSVVPEGLLPELRYVRRAAGRAEYRSAVGTAGTRTGPRPAPADIAGHYARGRAPRRGHGADCSPASAAAAS